VKVIDTVCDPGGSRPNEDRVGHADGLAWVIDGATDLEPDAFLPASSDVQWLVDRIGAHLRRPTATPAQGARELLRGLGARIGADLRELGFPPDRIHPTCSIGLLVEDGSSLELCRVGDPTCLALGQREIVLSTDFFGRQESRAVGTARSGGLADEDVRRGIMARRQQYIEGRLAESVFSGHPKARFRFQSVRVDGDIVSHVLLCSDGFARAVVDYGLYRDWPALVETALRQGLETVVDAIRACERQADRTGAARHFKKSDDAAAILVAVGKRHP
jgi:hypothetical protein